LTFKDLSRVIFFTIYEPQLSQSTLEQLTTKFERQADIEPTEDLIYIAKLLVDVCIIVVLIERSYSHFH
jgi:hypothetical protein